MRSLKTTVFLLSVLLVLLWRACLEPLGFTLLPLGALMVFPLIYFRWFSTLLFAMVVGILWESATPMPFGSVALPLCVTTVLLQLLGRHQFRANLLTRVICAALLQSVVTLTIGLKFPPQTFAGVLLQTTEAMVQLCLACLICPLWIWGMEKLSDGYFHTDLEGVIKDL